MARTNVLRNPPEGLLPFCGQQLHGQLLDVRRMCPRRGFEAMNPAWPDPHRVDPVRPPGGRARGRRACRGPRDIRGPGPAAPARRGRRARPSCLRSSRSLCLPQARPRGRAPWCTPPRHKPISPASWTIRWCRGSRARKSPATPSPISMRSHCRWGHCSPTTRPSRRRATPRYGSRASPTPAPTANPASRSIATFATRSSRRVS